MWNHDNCSVMLIVITMIELTMVMILMCNPATSSRRSVAQFRTLGKFLDNQLASSSVCNKNFRLGNIFGQLDSNILAHLLTMMMNEPMKTTMVKTRMTAPITS